MVPRASQPSGRISRRVCRAGPAGFQRPQTTTPGPRRQARTPRARRSSLLQSPPRQRGVLEHIVKPVTFLTCRRFMFVTLRGPEGAAVRHQADRFHVVSRKTGSSRSSFSTRQKCSQGSSWVPKYRAEGPSSFTASPHFGHRASSGRHQPLSDATMFSRVFKMRG